MIAKFLGTYSNGWGHMLISGLVIVCFTILLAIHAINSDIFTSIVSPIVLFWFGTGIANKALRTQQQQITTTNKENTP